MSFMNPFSALYSAIGFTGGLISVAPSGLISLLTYVFTSLGVYTIARRRGISFPWLAWIPLANLWVLGSISDQYRYVVWHRVTARRVTLIVLEIIFAVLSAAAVLVVLHLFSVLQFSGFGLMVDDYMRSRLVRPLVMLAVLAVPLICIAAAKTIIRYIALHDVYASCDPENRVLFLVLSIFFCISIPFFLFFSREKDYGMPPRRDDPRFWQPNVPQYPGQGVNY